jgi:drug/metabolite transporter (DMT)-like permease
MTTAPVLGLILLSALGYAGATVVMARFGSQGVVSLVPVVAVALLLAVLAEIAALRHLPIAIVYLAILGIETLLVLAAATWLGQSVGPREVVGAVLILSGALVLVTAQG